MSRSHKGYTWPGYNYLGPGNDLDEEEEIVDSTDFIAHQHDFDYSLAKSKEEVRLADRKAIQKFSEDFKETGRIADIAGVVGLSVKYGVESVTGVLYPSMSNKQNIGQICFAQRERHLADLWKSLKSKYVNYQDFKKGPEAQQLYAAYRKDGHFYNQIKKDLAKQNIIVREPEADEPGPSKRPAADTGRDNNPDPKQPRVEPVAEGSDTGEVSNPLSPESFNVLQDLLNTSDSTDLSEGANRADSRIEAAVPMDVDQSGSSRGPNTGPLRMPQEEEEMPLLPVDHQLYQKHGFGQVFHQIMQV